jgi:hypothetical protein
LFYFPFPFPLFPLSLFFQRAYPIAADTEQDANDWMAALLDGCNRIELMAAVDPRYELDPRLHAGSRI